MLKPYYVSLTLMLDTEADVADWVAEAVTPYLHDSQGERVALCRVSTVPGPVLRVEP